MGCHFLEEIKLFFLNENINSQYPGPLEQLHSKLPVVDSPGHDSAAASQDEVENVKGVAAQSPLLNLTIQHVAMQIC